MQGHICWNRDLRFNCVCLSFRKKFRCQLALRPKIYRTRSCDSVSIAHMYSSGKHPLVFPQHSPLSDMWLLDELLSLCLFLISFTFSISTNCWNFGFRSTLVKMSDTLSSLGTYLSLILPSAMHSQMKWYLTSICLVCVKFVILQKCNWPLIVTVYSEHFVFLAFEFLEQGP